MKAYLIKVGKRVVDDFKQYKIAIVAFVVYSVFVRTLFHAFCPMVIVSGLPCPGCGMTRAILYFLKGEWVRGWNLQPQAILWIAFFLIVVIGRYFLGKSWNKFFPAFVILLVCLSIGYFYRMFTQFPSYPPMTYRYGNLLEKVIPFYRDALRLLWRI